MQKSKTVIFERKYNVDIADFHTTIEVDDFIESKTGRKLRIKDIRQGATI